MAFLKILHKIWKNLIFLPLISYFMTYHSKIHIKDSKFNNKLSRPNFRPFWTPVNFLKLMKPDLYNFFESSFWTPRWCSFLVYMPFSWRNSFVNKWYLVGVVSLPDVLFEMTLQLLVNIFRPISMRLNLSCQKIKILSICQKRDII